MLRYPVELTRDDNDTLLVGFPDFPEAHTFGDDREEALARAVDALETVIDVYIRDRRPIPAPSPVNDESVSLPALVDAKVQIYNAMLAGGVGKAALAKRLNVHLPQVDRLLDVKHGSKVEQLEAAADALGGRLEMFIRFGLGKNNKMQDKATRLLSHRRRATALGPAGALADGGHYVMGDKNTAAAKRKRSKKR